MIRFRTLLFLLSLSALTAAASYFFFDPFCAGKPDIAVLDANSDNNPYDDDRYMPVYERIEILELPVLFHTGDFRPSSVDPIWRRPVLRNMDPVALDRIARSFPKLNIVMAHLGTTVWRVPAAELVKTHPNLYTDLAGHGSFAALSADDLAGLLGPRRHVYGVELGFFHKLVFGSDAYVNKPLTLVSALDYYRHLLDRLGLPDELRVEIMGGTVGRWLGIPL